MQFFALQKTARRTSTNRNRWNNSCSPVRKKDEEDKSNICAENQSVLVNGLARECVSSFCCAKTGAGLRIAMAGEGTRAQPFARASAEERRKR